MIRIRRRPTAEELADVDPDVARTWRTLATACRDRDDGTWAGLSGLLANASRMGAKHCSRYALRLGLRELVDAEIIYCTPDPSAGGRLPD